MDWLRNAAADRPGAPALITPERTISYGELDRAADGLAAIIASSARQHAAVGFVAASTAEAVAAIWAIPRLGALAVPIDPHAQDDAAAVADFFPPGDIGFDEMLAAPQHSAHDGMPGDARFVVFTSGSEGARKGVLLTGVNIAAAVTASSERLRNGADDPWLAVLPLFHIGGLSVLWRQAAVGAPVVLEPRFDGVRCAKLLPTVAFASLVPTMLRRMLDAGARGGGRLRGVLVGGGPIDTQLLRRAADAEIPALPTYGLTEACSQVCTVAPGDSVRDLGTVGRPLAGVEIRIGNDGRIDVRGAMVSSAYLGEPPRSDEWFVTGDLGSIDDEGRLTVAGRADAVIVTGGENVQPEAVVAALRSVAGVVDARVFGEPDAEWGSVVVAEVVLNGTTVAAVDAGVRNLLRRAEMPRRWVVVESLPVKLSS